MRRLLLLSFLAFLFAANALAHMGHHHGPQGHSHAAKLSVTPKIAKVYLSINQDYREKLAPIFEKKCAACHSAGAPSPWYSILPGLHQVIERDRREAKEHIEISGGFPFAGHGTPAEDIDAIQKAVADDSMPTVFYKLMHPSSRLSKEEKKTILLWAAESEKRISRGR